MAKIGADLAEAARFLENDIIGIPTETVYGLAANVWRPDLVARIFAIKNRPDFDPLIVHTFSLEEAQKLSKEFPEPLLNLCREFWPGPLTVLVPKSEEIPYLVTSGLSQVALRVPDHPLLLQLLQGCGFPLAAPSANPFGYVSPTTAAHVDKQLGDKIPYILDGGPARVGLESTIAGMEDGRLTIYRLGGLSIEKIQRFAGPVKLVLNQSSNPRAPGMLKSHYSPSIKTILDSNPDGTILAANPFLLRFKEMLYGYPEHLQLVLSPDGDMEEAASRLFGALRQADESGCSMLVAEPVPEHGLGRAINDRLRRAATP